jgi:GT2 family glycosyltransferase
MFSEPATSVTRRAIIVTGMHRSGTSALTRVLGLRGVSLPIRTAAPLPDNETGFWEPKEVVVIHDEMLAAAGSSWHDLSDFPASWLTSDYARPFKDRLVAAVREDFADAPIFVVKDPRICRLVPLWLSILEEVGAAPLFVLPIRNPLEVAASLKERNGFPEAKSLLLWLRHVLAAERDTRGLPRSFVAYDRLLRDCRGTVERIGQDLQLEWPHQSHIADVEIERFLSSRHRHHVFSENDVLAPNHITDWVKSVFDWAMRAAAGRPASPAELDHVRQAFDTADAAFMPLVADREISIGGLTHKITVLAAESVAQQAEIQRLQEVQQSIARLRDEAERSVARLQDEATQIQASADQAARVVADRQAMNQQMLNATRAAAWNMLEICSRRLAAVERRADQEGASARSAERRLQHVLDSEFWKVTAPLRSGVMLARRFTHLQIGRSRLLRRALSRQNRHERRILVAALRRRLGLGTPDVEIAGVALPSSAPHEAAIASYAVWQLRFDTPDAPDVERLAAMAADRPEIHIIVHISPDAVHVIERTISALKRSIGLRWTTHFAFDPGCVPDTIARYRTIVQDDARFGPEEVGPIPDGAIVVLLEGGAIPRPHGAVVLVDALLGNPGAILAYADEDCLPADGPSERPWFKPDYSPLLAEQGLLFGRMVALRPDAEALISLTRSFAAPSATIDMVVRDVARAAGETRIVHVPHVLFHDALPPTPPIVLALPPLPTPLPLTSILIPTRNGWNLLGPCLESLKKTDWPKDRLEIIVIDNGSSDIKTIEGMAAAEGAGQIRILRDSRPFNYARLNNFAARAAQGELLVLLNNDTEVIDPAWLRKLAAYAMQPWAGAVGPKLLYPDGKVQHGGVVVGIQGVAAHAHVLLGTHDAGYHGLAKLTHEVTALTGACLAVSRAAYEEVGGLDEAFRVAFNDIALCLSLHAAGRRNVYVGEPLLVHHESKTRGIDDTPEKIRISRTEARQVWQRHGSLLRNDPFYSPNLSLEVPYRLAFAPRRRPAWRAAASGSPLKVMMLSSTHAQGYGVAVVINLQVQALLARGHEVIAAGIRSDRDFAYGGHDVIEVHDPRSAATLAVSLGVDVIVAHTPPFFGVARWTGAYPPVLAYDYGEPPPDFFPDAAARREVLDDKNVGLAICSRRLAISEAVANEAVVPPDGILPLGNGHLGRWNPELEDRRRRVRRERGWETSYVVLNVCRFHVGERAYKGVDQYADLREALNICDPALATRIVFVLCGKGTPQDVEAMQSRGLYVVANVADGEMADLYAAADLYANFSRWEGYNLGIGQALAMGLPVLASNIPAHRAFGVPVANDLIEAATLLSEQADRPPERRPQIWEWDGPLTAFVAEVEALSSGKPGVASAVGAGQSELSRQHSDWNDFLERQRSPQIDAPPLAQRSNPVTIAPDNPLLRFEQRPPSNQTATDVFRDRWASDLQPLLGVTGTGAALLFTHDRRPEQAAIALGVDGRLSGFKVLELGPLEAAHSYLLEGLDAASVVAVEANVEAFLKCLVVKELLQLSKSKFLLGDILEYLKSKPGRFDLVFCSGVLYHMSDPLELIRLICGITDRCFVWTHYYDAERHPVPFKAQSHFHAGFKATYWSHNYGDRTSQFWGGNKPSAVWLERDTVLAAFQHFGLSDLTIINDDHAHPNGPGITFAARRPS